MNSKFGPLEEFWRGIKGESTKRFYTGRLEAFFEFLRAHDELNFKGDLEKAHAPFDIKKFPILERASKEFKARASEDAGWAYYSSSFYFDHMKEEIDKAPIEKRDSMASTLWNFHKAVKKFCDMTDITINWKKVDIALPRPKGYAKDSKIELEQLQSLLEYKDPRIKPIVLLSTSAGIDVSAFDYLSWKDVQPIYDEADKTKIIAGKIHTYKKKTGTWYDTFVTPEAYASVEANIEERFKDGEITAKDSNSPIIRNLYYPQKNHRKESFAHIPKRLRTEGVLEVVKNGLKAKHLRKPLAEGVTRYEFKTTKSFRKFYTTALDDAGVAECLTRATSSGFRRNTRIFITTCRMTAETRLKGCRELELSSEEAFWSDHAIAGSTKEGPMLMSMKRRCSASLLSGVRCHKHATVMCLKCGKSLCLSHIEEHITYEHFLDS